MHIAQVREWSEGPRYLTVNDPPAPAKDEIQLRVLAAGLHQVVRSRASGKHYSAKELPHTVGLDCVARDEATGKLVYCIGNEPGFGTFAERINIDKNSVYKLPDGADPASFAASVNPAMSGWMAITQRTTNLPKNWTALIMGATSASGRLAVYAARDLGAGRVVGVARNAEALAKVDGLDEQIVLKDNVAETDFSKLDCDVILDYVYGDAAMHLLSSLKTKKPVQYVHIGSLSGPVAALPGHVLRSSDLTIRGAGPGSYRMSALKKELQNLVPKMGDWKLLDAHTEPLANVEKAWNNRELASKGRLVFIP